VDKIEPGVMYYERLWMGGPKPRAEMARRHLEASKKAIPPAA